MHTILGYKGAIGQAVLRDLQSRNLKHRLVSRSANAKIPLEVKADLRYAKETEIAIKGSDFVYLCIGLPYNHKVWEKEWPIIMNNVIDACIRYEAKLIFLDNIYMYSHNLPIPFDEKTLQQPKSKKGKVRKRISDIFVDAYSNRGLNGLIARSADFYGKGAKNSVFYLSFLDRILDGKRPQLLSVGNVKHTFANVDDNARAMVELALCECCFGQVWHLPVGPLITMNEVLELINDVLNTNFETSVMPNSLKKILPYFIPNLREPLEMQYQFEAKYEMNFNKFKKQFPNFKITPYKEGIRETINWFIQAKANPKPLRK
ncbi:MAG: NAD-dependent epimerase/dehydratase family protein [Bacteroidota bacterium]